MPRALILAVAVAFPTAALAEETRELSAPAPAGARFGIENLVGTMTVVSRDQPAATVRAIVHAETGALADAVKLVTVTREGRPTLLVRYPEGREFRAPRATGGDRGWLAGWLGHSHSSMEYDGRKVSVGSRGPLVYVDVEIALPRADVDAVLRNHVGNLTGTGVRGTLLFDTASGDVRLEGGRGRIRADTGSGTVSARDIEGRFSCDTGSGDCVLAGFQGDEVSCDTGSGDVRISGATAQRLHVDTGSGEVAASVAGAETVDVDTGSGEVDLTLPGAKLTAIRASTGSGGVRLRLDPGAAFEARADMGSGDIVNRYADAQPIVHRREVTGYRRGDARIRIDVETGSGDLVLEPLAR